MSAYKLIPVLIVDDMPAMRIIMKNMLDEIGFVEIVQAEDGETALQFIEEGEYKFGLVISDWNLPGMSGVDLLRSVRYLNETKDLPFLMATARGNLTNLFDAALSGVSDYVVKPFNKNQLKEKIDIVLGFSTQTSGKSKTQNVAV